MKLGRATCRTVRDLLPLHVGGDLEVQKAELVDEHLHRCLACFREYRELLMVRGHLGVLADQPLPPGVLDGFTDEVMARIALGEPGPAAELPGSSRPLQRVLRYAAAAAVLLALGLGLASLNDLPPSQAPPGGRAPSGTVVRSLGSTPAAVSAPARPVESTLPMAARPFGASVAVPVSAGDAPTLFRFDSPDGLLQAAEPVGLQPMPHLWPSRLRPDPNRELRLR
jgi:anti-sigma factor RsiW